MSDQKLDFKKKLKKTDLIKIKEEKYLIVSSVGDNYTLIPVSSILDGKFDDNIEEILLPQLNVSKEFIQNNSGYELLDDYEKLMLLVSKNYIVQKTIKNFLKA